jgi:hypothetical protein
MAAHYYDISAAGLITYLEHWHNTFHLDMLLTEFACQVRCDPVIVVSCDSPLFNLFL